ncbi:MAG: RHS repeat-associated core domain-containing protein, partial [Gammaproteobacteria bacterium]
AGRCGDMGLGVWCGGYFPMYEVFLGSSNVWIEGARAARVVVDITKHCLFTTPKPQDLPIGPMLGTTISCSPNVMIGGIPMPSLTALALGAVMRSAFKLAGKGARAFARASAPLRRRMGSTLNEANSFLRCKVLRAEPVNFITGEVSVEQQDFSLPGIIPLDWNRCYGSQRFRSGVCGYGWSTQADARLVFEDDGAVTFDDGLGAVALFPWLPTEGTVRDLVDGATLSVTGETLRVHLKNSLTYVFERNAPGSADTSSGDGSGGNVFKSGAGGRPRSNGTFVRTLAGALPSRPAIEGSYLPITQMEDNCGNSLRFIRDDDGLRQIIESAGRRLEFTSKAGLVTEIRIRHSDHHPPRVLARYEYSASNELTAVHDALGNTRRFRYEHERLVRHTTRNGLSFHYEYAGPKASARCIKAWGDGGLYSYGFTFDPVLKRVTTTNSLGAVSTAQLNDLSLPIWEMDPLGGITKYEYDDRGRTIAVTDRDGNGSRYQYDESGNLLELTRADGSTIRTSFDEHGKPVSITDPNGAQWTQKWDPRGLLLERTTPLGNVSRYGYDVRGQLIRFTNARGARTQMDFDNLGNLIRSTDVLGRSTRFGYDALGNLTARVDALDRKTHYRYDAGNRLTEVKLPSGATLACEYDGEGNLTRHIDERGSAIQFEYFGLGLLKRRQQSDGRSVEYGYDSEERLVSVTNQRGETYRLKRDVLGRVFEEVDYWGQVTTLGFDASGHLKESRDPLGRVIRFTTDKMGRVRSTRSAHALQPDRFSEETFDYDLAGYLIGCGNEHIRVQRQYDAEGNLVEEHQGDFKIRNAYDAGGNRIQRETSAGNTTKFGYDVLGQLESIAINDEPPLRIERDREGQARRETLGSGLERLYEYDSDGHLTHQGIRRGSGWLFQTHYQYDASGNLTIRRDSSQGTDHYDYDPLGQVVRHTDPQEKLNRFFQDPAGDRLRTEVASDDGATEGSWNRQGQYEGAHYRFDRAGQLTRRDTEVASTEFTWDAAQRLVRTQTQGLETRYGYDPLGRRVFKQTGTEKACFRWDADALVAEKAGQGDGASWREYVYYPSTFEPVALIDSTSQSKHAFYYSNDPNGCPTRVISPQGDVVWAARYTPYGEATVLIGKPGFNPLRFQGQYADEETGLYYNRHRYYDPAVGQFISPDPIGLLAGTNFYQYAPNTLAWADPLGLDTHYLDAWIERNGEVLAGTQKPVSSGGQTAEQAGRWGLGSHTEPKYLREYGHVLQPNDVVHMQGTRDPCAPGCQPLLRDLADGNHVVDDLTDLKAPPTKTVYHASDTGRTWTFRKATPGEFGRAKADVIVEIAEANGSHSMRRYWRKPNGGWTSKKVRIGCG